MTTEARAKLCAFEIKPIDLPTPCSSDVHFQVQQFLNMEAYLLDHNRLSEWVNILATDLRYFIPVRQTKRRAKCNDEFTDTIGHMDDTFASIAFRVHRLVSTKSAWAEDPASRVRRFITNVVVSEADAEGEYDVVSYLLLTRNRFYQDEYEQLSAERKDRIRRVGDSFELVSREVMLDQSVLGMPNLAIFL